jgi:hypothetical protein
MGTAKPCLFEIRFAADVAVGSRNTRFQAARYALPGLDFHQLIAPTSWRTLCPPYRIPTKKPGAVSRPGAVRGFRFPKYQ